MLGSRIGASINIESLSNASNKVLIDCFFK